MSTHDEVESAGLIGTGKPPREWQLPLIFFSSVLALWVAAWFGVSLLV